jgi:hypothetical protein
VLAVALLIPPVRGSGGDEKEDAVPFASNSCKENSEKVYTVIAGTARTGGWTGAPAWNGDFKSRNVFVARQG